MKKLLVVIACICGLFVLTSCQNNTTPTKLKVETVSESNVEDWKIEILTRLDHKKWVYDVRVNYLGKDNVAVTIKTLPDGNEYAYEKVSKEPLMLKGGYDYEPSVYSKENDEAIIKLNWTKEGTSKVNTGEATYRLVPVYK